MSMKNSNDNIGFELANFGLVAQCHNRLLHRVPYFGGAKTEKKPAFYWMQNRDFLLDYYKGREAY
jgi:hypothetical protein